jgi:hypothetical protein
MEWEELRWFGHLKEMRKDGRAEYYICITERHQEIGVKNG